MTPSICNAPICDRKAMTISDLCAGHEMRRRKGKPIDTPIEDVKYLPQEVRFWRKVRKTPTCWLWTGPLTDGYGNLMTNQRSLRAHRVSYEMHKGEIPADLYVDHKCRVRHCVNPDHLQLVTFRQNLENASVRRDSTTGVRGVTWSARQRRYIVRANAADGTRVSGGRFTDLAEAEAAAIALRNRLMTNNLADREQAA